MRRATLRPGQRTKRGERIPDGLKAVYTLHELAELMGMPYQRTWSLVRASGIRLVRQSEKKKASRILVPLSSFRVAFPEIWDSILLVQQHRRRVAKPDEDDED